MAVVKQGVHGLYNDQFVVAISLLLHWSNERGGHIWLVDPD